MAERGPGPLMIDLAGPVLDAEERELLQHPLVGGVLLFTRNYENPRQLKELCGAVRSAAGRREILVATDHEGGRVQRFRDHFLELPPAGAYLDRWREDRAAAGESVRLHALATARELRERGLDLPFMPVVDLDRGNSEVIGDRAFGGEAEAVVSLATSYLHGLREGGLSATLKHFPGHGGVAGDSHEELPVDPRARCTLEREDLAPFRALIAEGAESVMMAHVQYPAVDARPASLSPVWVREILRGEYGFEGAIFCDDLTMGGAAGQGGYPDRAWLALEAGCDMFPVCNARAGVIEILDELPARVDRASAGRLGALRARAVQPG